MNEENKNAGKIKYYNNGPIYRPDMVAYGNLPDGGLSIYCYNEMPCPPDEAVILVNEEGNIQGEEDVHAGYNHVRFMQCGVRLTPEESNEMILTLMTTDNGSLEALRAWIKTLDPMKKKALKDEFSATMRYLFPASERQPKARTTTVAKAQETRQKAAAAAKPVRKNTLKGEDLNRYLDMLNRRKLDAEATTEEE